MSWQPIDLRDLPEREQVQPRFWLIYPGGRHVWSGAPGSGKSLIAAWVALNFIRTGDPVLWLDFEQGPYRTRERLREFGATDQDFADFLYVEPQTRADEDEISDIVARYQPALVVIDAAAGAFDVHGLDDNKRAEVERFASLVLQPFADRGVATLVLDHVVKASEQRGRWAIGSERKIGGADVHLGFDVPETTPIARGRTGIVKVSTRKDRDGWLRAPILGTFELVSDPDTGRITCRLNEPGVGDGWKPTALMERVSRYLEQHDDVSRTQIEKAGLGKRAEYIRVAIDQLITDGYASETLGPRDARLTRSLKPFRDTPSDPVPFSSNGVLVDPVHPVPPLQGDGDGDGDALQTYADRLSDEINQPQEALQ